MEGLLNASAAAEGDPSDAWASYLEQLRAEDPEEYELLIKDMEEMMKTQEEQSQVLLKPKDGEDGDLGGNQPEFKPKLPGGKVMDTEGVKKDEEQEEGQKVHPTPGFVLKTRTEKGDKVFVNICQSPLLQKMSKKKQLAEDGSEQEGINIPLSLGPPRIDTDKAGAKCTVYDLVVNPEVLTNAKEDSSGASRNFLCELALQYVEQKYKCKVDYQFKLPKLDYKGDKANIPFQLIRKKQAPVIEELDTDGNSSNEKRVPKKITTSATRRPPAEPLAYSLVKVQGDTRTPCEASLSDPVEIDAQDDVYDAIEFQAILERAVHEPAMLKALKVSVSSEMLSIRANGFILPLDLFLPAFVDEAKTECSFRKDTGLLVVRLPVAAPDDVYWRHSAKPDVGSRPWLLANALSNGEDFGPEVSTTNGAKPEQPEVEPTKEENPADETLPEDRFHLADMLSQHIKDERERERQEKIKRHEEEEVEKAKEKQIAEQKERTETIARVLSEAEEQVRNEMSKVSSASELLEGDCDDDDLLV
mmetsp:Transcript_20612/g.38366  ORF Transcript_20612/g.38366 Transcript_20612/m.38366 type:complete len:530 (+) Transcript_20612:113-1702(+)